MLDFMKFTLPLMGAAIVWLVNQWQQRSRDEYLRKEKLYRDLLDSLQGFYLDPTGPLRPPAGRQAFLDQVRLAWLYSPDDVISSAYSFLNTVHTDRGTSASDSEKETAFGNVVAAMRRDLLKPRFFILQRTKLTGADYRHFRPN